MRQTSHIGMRNWAALTAPCNKCGMNPRDHVYTPPQATEDTDDEEEIDTNTLERNRLGTFAQAKALNVVNLIRMFSICTDGGSEMVGSQGGRGGVRAMLMLSTASLHDLIVVWTKCILHQPSICVGRIIDQCGNRHFASWACTTNTWRSLGPARKISKALVDPKARCTEVIRKRRLQKKTMVPPRPIRTRWGPVHYMSAFYLEIGRHAVTRSVCVALNPACEATIDRELEEVRLAIEDLTESTHTTAYEVKVSGIDHTTGEEVWEKKFSRWSTVALKTVRSASRWLELIFSHAARGPIMHLHAYIETARPDACRQALASPPPSQAAWKLLPAVELVAVKLPLAMKDIAALASVPDKWPSEAWAMLERTARSLPEIEEC